MHKDAVRVVSLFLFLLAVVSCGQSAVPSAAPEASGVPSPTARVAVADTPVPTVAPTAVPTVPPTAAPTSPPTPRPTARPTRTAGPTSPPRPTHLPTVPATPAPTSNPEEKVLLQLNLEQGQAYDQRVIAEQIISQTMEGTSIVITQTTGFGYLYEVTEVDRGVATVQVTYNWVYMKQSSMFSDVEYDSDDPSSQPPPQAQGLDALLGEGFIFKVNNDGQVVDIEGVDELISHLLDKMDVPEGAQRDALDEQLRSQYGDEALKEGLERALSILPDRPVGIGDSWTQRQTLSVGMPMLLATTYTLVSRENGVSTLALHSIIAPPPEPQPISISGIELLYELSGEQQGTMQVDERTGWTLAGEITQHLFGKLTMQDLTGSGTSMTWPIAIDGTITYETTEK